MSYSANHNSWLGARCGMGAYLPAEFKSGPENKENDPRNEKELLKPTPYHSYTCKNRIPFYCLLLIILFTVSCSKKETTSPDKITVVTELVTVVRQTTANAAGQVSVQGSATITDKGVCWSTVANPTIASTKLSAGGGAGSFSATITGLLPSMNYFLRAYATTAAETSYGDQQQFTTTGYQLPVIAVQALSSVKQTTAVSGGVISSAGGGTISAKGLCWGTAINPTIADNKTTDGTGTTSFNSQMTKLNPSTTYYVRSYATNEAGTGYSASIPFTTLMVSTPLIDDVDVSSITTSNAIFVSNVRDDSGSPVTDKGICIGLTPNPTTTTAAVFTNGAGIGSIVAFIAGFISGTAYHVRSYATNSKGTSYSADVVFKML